MPYRFCLPKQLWTLPCISILLVLTFANDAVADHPKDSDNLRDRFSGSFFTTKDIDINGDGDGGSRTHLTGSSRRAHQPISYEVENDILPWDGSTYCAVDDAGNPVAVELTYIYSTFVRRSSNRNLLYGNMASAPPSTLCFNFVDNSYTLTLYYDLIGGEGRYRGATGQAVVSAEGTQFSATMGGLTGRLKGEVRLQ